MSNMQVRGPGKADGSAEDARPFAKQKRPQCIVPGADESHRWPIGAEIDARPRLPLVDQIWVIYVVRGGIGCSDTIGTIEDWNTRRV